MNKNCAVAGKMRDATVNFDRCEVCRHCCFPLILEAVLTWCFYVRM